MQLYPDFTSHYVILAYPYSSQCKSKMQPWGFKQPSQCHVKPGKPLFHVSFNFKTKVLKPTIARLLSYSQQKNSTQAGGQSRLWNQFRGVIKVVAPSRRWSLSHECLKCIHPFFVLIWTSKGLVIQNLFKPHHHLRWILNPLNGPQSQISRIILAVMQFEPELMRKTLSNSPSTVQSILRWWCV